MYRRLLGVVIVLSWLTGAGFFVLGTVAEVAAGEDTTPPVITLCGDASISIEVYSDYEDPGATAVDDIDGDISASITVGGTVDTAQVGSYTLTYDVTDAAGNAAETVTRTVHVVEVVPDIEPPVITLLGDNPLQLTRGSAYEEPGYAAVDDVDGDLTDRVSVTGKVYTDTPGAYALNYVVSDDTGNTAEAVRTVEVTEAEDLLFPMAEAQTAEGAPVLTGSGATPTYAAGADPVNIDPGLTLTYSDTIDGAKVSVSHGLVDSEDELLFAGQSVVSAPFTDTNGITGQYETETGILTLSGIATASEYQEALRSVQYRNSNPTPIVGQRTVTFSVGQNTLYCPDTGHYYEYVVDSGILWTSAESAASGREYYGLQGYLATITTDLENTFIKDKVSGNGWLGASDAAVEGIWEWVTGPEANTHFFTQTPLGAGGTPVGEMYNHWNSGEPNQAGDEDYAHMYGSSSGSWGYWNDLPNAASVSGYIVEYGGMAGDPVLQLTADVTVNVEGENDPPTISDIADQTTDEDIPTTAIAFTIGDVETPAADLQVTGSSSNTTLVPNYSIGFGGSGANRTVTVTPAGNRYGSATITVTVSDGQDTVSDSFLLTVNPVNDQPVAVGDSKTGLEDTSLTFTATDLTVNDEDPDNDILTVIGVAPVPDIYGQTHCSVSLSGDQITYTPDADYNSIDKFSYTVSDGDGGTVTSLVTVTVKAVNDAPYFTKGSDQTVGEDAGVQSVAGWAAAISAGPANESGQTLNFNVTGNTNPALFTVQPAVDSVTGTLTYTPAENANGSATVTVTLHDNGGTANGGVDTSLPQTFTITVTPVNDAPVAVDGNVDTGEDTPVEINLLASDIDSGSLTYTIVAGPSRGSLSTIDGNRVSYTPDNDYHGSDTFTFRASDGSLDSNTATISLTVTPVNDAPWVSPITDRLTENSRSVRDIPFSIGDIDNDVSGLTVSARSSDQSIVTDDRLTITGTAGTRALTIVPNGRVGTTTITVTVSDGELTGSESFVLTTYRDKRDEVAPATTGLSSSDFIARWEDSIPLQVKPVKMMSPQPEIALRASDAGNLARAVAQGLEPRVYVWNEKFKKWVALASYRQADGSVRALNDHNYTGWMAVFAIRQPRFIDVKPTDWYEPVLNRANGLALLEGYAADPQNPDGLERYAKPRAAMTRAEYVTMITRAFGLVGEDQIPMYRILQSVPPEDVAVVLERFTDGAGIPRWCRSSIAAAVQSDLLKDIVGMQDSFSPATPINRLQAAVIVSNALAELPGFEYRPADLSAFTDAARIPAWAEGRVAEGVIVGDANGCFQPDAPLTRAEAYTLLLRLLRDLGW